MKYDKTKTRYGLLGISVFFAALFVGRVMFGADRAEPVQKIKKMADKAESALDKKLDKNKIKETFHEAADQLDKEHIHAVVDRVADQIDPEKLKEAVDTIAEYLDKEKIKQAIDQVSASLDREKVKVALDNLIDYIDKEELKESFDVTVDRIAESMEEVKDLVKKEAQRFGSDLASIQKQLDRYDWKTLVSDKATFDVATLSDLKLNGHKKVAIVKPGEAIKGEVVCNLNREECSSLAMYRVVIGIKNAQNKRTTICNHMGIRAKKETDPFALTAPEKPGIYQVGFRVVKSALETTALQEWDEKAAGWDKIPTIGLIIVQ